MTGFGRHDGCRFGISPGVNGQIQQDVSDEDGLLGVGRRGCGSALQHQVNLRNCRGGISVGFVVNRWSGKSPAPTNALLKCVQLWLVSRLGVKRATRV